MRIRFFVAAILYLFGSVLFGQNYPISASISLHPPLSNLLSQFSSEPEKISITLINKDFATPQIDGFLRIRIEGAGLTIETPETYKPNGAITITAGSPLLLNGNDIGYLLDPANLNFQGISKGNFLSSGSKLPEGLYKFTLTVFEYNQDRRISNEAFSYVTLFKHQPPIINVPQDGSNVNAQTPQNLQIQFTPRHTISAALVGKVRYKIRMVEVVPAGRNANDAMQSSAVPFFETITDNTTFIYGPGEPQLVQGMTYALQVQAIDVDDKDIFDNAGYSQIVSFVYGQPCPIPQKVVAVKGDGSSLEISWDSHARHRAYTVWYKASNGTELAEMVFTNAFSLNGLKPGTSYTITVSGSCAEVESSRSLAIRITTDTAKSAYQKWAGNACGKPLPSIDLSNKKPLLLLQAQQKILAADFEVTVLSATGANGVFSGSGTVLLPFTGKIPIPCSFENISLNSDRRLIQGKIQVLRQPLEISNRSIGNVSKKFNQYFGQNWNRWTHKYYTGKIETIAIDKNGNPIIKGSGGSAQIQGGRNLEIVDNTGFRWFISAGGKISKSEAPQENPVVTNSKTGEGTPGQLRTGLPKVFFATQASNGYDAKELSNLTAGNTYDQMDCNDTAYYPGWKLLQTGSADSLEAWFTQGKIIPIHPDSVHFLRSDGTRLRSRKLETGHWMVYLTGHLALQADAIWAVARTNLGNPGVSPMREILGKINLITVDQRKLYIHLVPVNGLGKGLSAKSIESEVNKLLANNGIQTEIDLQKGINEPKYNNETEKIGVNRGLLNTGYGESLQRFIRQLETQQPHASHYTGSDTAWMFILNQSEDKSDGYMAINRNYGFLFLNQSNKISAHTLSHEIGHGLLSLEHSFGENSSDAGRSHNLMDYSPPYGLLHYKQWMQVFDPELLNKVIIGNIQKARKGKFIGTKGGIRIPDSYYNNDKVSVNYISPGGEIVAIWGLISECKFAISQYLDQAYPGSLVGFEYDNKWYEYIQQEGEWGYFSGNLRYDLERYKNADQQIVTLLYTTEGAILYQFTCKNIPYFNSNGAIRQNSNFPLRWFSTNCTLKNETSIIKYKWDVEPNELPALDNTLDGRLNFEIQLVLQKNATQQTYTEAIEIASIFFQSPVFVRQQFVRLFDEWQLYPSGANIPLGAFDKEVFATTKLLSQWQNNDPLFYTYLFDEFNKFQDKLNTEAEELLKRLEKDDYKAVGYREKILKATQIVREESLRGLINRSQRTLAISLLLNNWRVGESTELALIKLINYINDGEICDFINENLVGKSRLDANSFLLELLVSAIDNKTLGVGGDNYLKLILTLSHLAIQCETNRLELDAALSINISSRKIEFYDQSAWSLVRDYLWKKFGSENDVTAKNLNAVLVSSNGFLEVKVKLEYNVGGKTQSQTEPVLEPFGLYYITNNSALPTITSLISPGSEMVLPGIALTYMARMGINAFAEDVANTALDVLSLATGTYALRVATTLNTYRRVLAISDLVSGVSGLAFTATKNNEAYKELNNVFTSVQLLSGGVGLIDFAKSLKLKSALNKEINPQVIQAADVNNFFQAIQTDGAKLKALPELDALRVELLIELKQLKAEANILSNQELLQQVTTAEKTLGIADAAAELKRLEGVNGVGKVLTSKPSWLPNRIISGNISNPKGLIGVYDKNIPGLGIIDDTKRMLSEIDFPMCNASNFKTASKDGFKLLNVPNDAVDMWATYNKPWIEALTNAKAEIAVLSDKGNALLKYAINSDGTFKLVNGQKVLTGFGKEIDFMETLVQQGKYQFDNVAGSYKYIGN